MAIQNPSTLYSAGNVTFDSRPATMFYLQSQAQKRAKADAIDNYFRDLGKSLTPSGMSPDDVPEFIDKSNKYKQFAIQNRDALRNPSMDNGRAMQQANFLYNDALEHSARSVGKVKNISIIPNLNPEDKDRLVEHGWDAIQQASLPVSDPNYKPFNPSDLSYNPKQFSLEDQSKLIENLTKNKKMGEKRIPGVTDPKTFMRPVTTTALYEQPDLEQIGVQAASEYLTNKSYKQKIDKIFDDSYNKETRQVEINPEFNKAFKDVYGKDIHTKQELGAAYALNAIQKQVVKEDTELDKVAFAKEMEAIKQRGRLSLQKKKLDAAKLLRKGDAGWVNPYMEGVIGAAQGELSALQSQSIYSEQEPVINDPLLSKSLARNGQEPDVIKYTKDGRIKPIYYQRYGVDDPSGKGLYSKGDVVTDSKGVAKEIETFSKPISVQQMKALMLRVAPNSKLDALEMGMIFDEEPESGDDLGFEWK